MIVLLNPDGCQHAQLLICLLTSNCDLRQVQLLAMKIELRWSHTM